MVVGVGEGARGALGHRGDRYPVGGRIHTPTESAPGGKATPPITGRWDHGWLGWSGTPVGFPPGTITRRGAPDLIRRTPRVCNVLLWYGSEGLHQAVAPAIGV